MICPGDYLVWDIGFAFDLELGKDGNMATLSARIPSRQEDVTYSEGKWALGNPTVLSR